MRLDYYSIKKKSGENVKHKDVMVHVQRQARFHPPTSVFSSPLDFFFFFFK